MEEKEEFRAKRPAHWPMAIPDDVIGSDRSCDYKTVEPSGMSV